MSQGGQEKLQTSGMSKEELIEFFKDVTDGVKMMNRRQRWEFRRDLKTFCRIANIQWPYGKPEAEEPIEVEQKSAPEAEVPASEETGC